ncbi:MULTISPECIES: MFS transporter [unclassified Ruegeria]|uniref:MFS transporter n=2 Tax=unclassified Ruegeria TaxID=2625375 RepID=UPI001FD7B7E0|nr:MULTISPECIES: MFS transporter [unclassified Ruegeria]
MRLGWAGIDLWKDATARPMTPETPDAAKRNVPVLTGQSIMSQVAWTLGSPSVVLPFLAVSFELPMFVAGALVSVRMVGSMISDFFLAQSVAAKSQKKRAIALTEAVIGACLVTAMAAAATGIVPLIAVIFVSVFFVIGLVDEVQNLMFTDLLGDHLHSRSRMVMQYLQLGGGGLCAIGLALLVHQITKENPPFSRHSTMIGVSVAFFMFSGLLMLAMTENAGTAEPAKKAETKPKLSFRANVQGILSMFEFPWFRRFMIMRMPLVAVTLSVPFFALIAAEAHHSSAQGLTAMIVSSASGYLVSGPLWQFVNMKSHRAVMMVGTLMVAATGSVLLAFHYLGIDHDVHLHAIALFVVTVAVTGISSARKLYFLDIAPKDLRVQGTAAVKSITRLSAVLLSAALAAVAHMHEVALAVAFIVAASLVSCVTCYRMMEPVREDVSQPQE